MFGCRTAAENHNFLYKHRKIEKNNKAKMLQGCIISYHLCSNNITKI